MHKIVKFLLKTLILTPCSSLFRSRKKNEFSSGYPKEDILNKIILGTIFKN